MRRLLSIIIGVQLLLGLWWTGPLLFHDGTFTTLYIFFISLIANAAFYLVAGWAMWKYPDQRRKAAAVLALPVALYVLPFAIKFVAGGDLTGSRGIGVLTVLGIALLGFCLFFPGRAFRLLPRGLVQNRFMNWLILVGLIAAWVLPVALIIWLAAGDSGSSSGTAVAYAIYYFAIYIVFVGAAALLVMLWGWIGVRGDADNPSRKLHIAQLVMGSPSLVIGILTMSWLASQQ